MTDDNPMADPWTDAVLKFAGDNEAVTIVQVMDSLSLPVSARTVAAANRIREILRRDGWSSENRRQDAVIDRASGRITASIITRVWFKPPEAPPA